MIGLAVVVGFVLPEKSGVTLRELRIKLNVTEKYLSRVETGRQTASIDLLVDIAIALNASMDVLVWGDGMSHRAKLLELRDELVSITKELSIIANEIV